MNYLLTVLANGRGEYLERALQSFLQHVRPSPMSGFIMDDGGRIRDLERILDMCPWPWEIDRSPQTIGMCKAHAHCWHAAAASKHEWVFHLEEDFVILRPVDLNDIGLVLTNHDNLAQMALVRCPWGAEIPFGGYIPKDPGWYTRVQTDGLQWIETRRNWATNPALFKTSVCRDFQWPLEQCETAIGFQMLERDTKTRFGLWGWGEPWAAHIGVEKTPGAFGF